MFLDIRCGENICPEEWKPIVRIQGNRHLYHRARCCTNQYGVGLALLVCYLFSRMVFVKAVVA